MIGSALVLSLFLAGAPAAPADDIASKIISVPVPSAYRVDGQQGPPEIRSDPKVQGGKALRVHVPGKQANDWAISVAVPITKPVKAGDALVLAFWGKLAEGENGATTSLIPFNAVQVAHAPYTPVFFGPVTLEKDWKMLTVKGKADKDYKADDLVVSLHLATAKQVVDIGPVFVLDLGQ